MSARLVPSGPIARALAGALLLVAASGLAIEVAHAASPGRWGEWLVPLFSLSYEQNLPTWYAASLLFVAGWKLAHIAHGLPATAAFRRRWWGLCAIFIYMSLDEVAELHERLGGLFDTGGVLYFDWVIPGAVFVAVAGLIYLPFVRALPAPTRGRVVVAGALFVTGALLMELPLGMWTERGGPDNLTYALIDWVEEVLELAGATLFLLALADHERQIGLEEGDR